MTTVVRLTLAYDGTGFRGWARQRDPAIRTIEGSLTELLEQILQEPVKLSVAGRTDAGVHARGQVASFRTTSGLEPERLRRAVNGRLAPEVVVLDAVAAPDGFDARFSATAREYRYRIDERDPPIRSSRATRGAGPAGSRWRRCGRPPARSWGSATSRASAVTRAPTDPRSGT